MLLVLRMVEYSRGVPLNPEDDPSRKFSPLQNRKLLENAFQSRQTGPPLPDWTPFDFHGEDRANSDARRIMLLADLLKDDPVKIASRRSDLSFMLLVDSPWHEVDTHSSSEADLALTGGNRSLPAFLGSLSASQSMKQILFAHRGTLKQSNRLLN